MCMGSVGAASVAQDPVILHHQVAEIVGSSELGVLAFESLFADRTGQAARSSNEDRYTVINGLVPQFPQSL